MAERNRILALVGSLRAASVTRRLAEAAAHAVSDDIDLVIYDKLGEVPFYNEDHDVADAVPAAAVALRTAAEAADGLLVLTPEYNGSTPAALKNAIDWLSRPYGASAIKGKPVAVVSASISPNAAKWAHADTAKAIGIAGATVIDEASLHFGATGARFAAAHPREDAETSAQLAASVRRIVATARGGLVVT